MAVGREKSIFLSALDRETSDAREAFLQLACAGDSHLREIVDRLLMAHHRPINLLDQPLEPSLKLRQHLDNAEEAAKLADPSMPLAWGENDQSERAGEVIGNFQLMEKIGEGGFGQVFVADQQQPVRRRVALKLLKPGMDSREVIARFEAERQALAMMEHPNIARVFDAGTTAAGQPYFVMELVRGVPVTTFCNENRLTVRQRLELFIDMCQAVQHAHQKGVIHRDLKPSNVMVARHDAQAVVKVIDFGVAKAISEPLTEKTVYTRFSQMIGTPLYMSPEQAEMSGLDVDTRSDIYSLGVLLYEMLTGTTPFDGSRLIHATFDELRRIIREEEPPRPSARSSTLSDSGTVARLRSDSRTLSSTLRGDLDCVVMKALEKDRERRYATAAELGRDVQRYLDQLPVVARPPSALYRFSKYARRHKVIFTTASLITLSLVTGTVMSTWQAILATKARAEAESLREDAVEFANRLKESNVLLDSARANTDQRRWDVAFEQYTRATKLQPDHYLTWSGRGSLFVRLGAWKAAAADFSNALQLGAPANNPGWWGVPQLCLYASQDEAYELACKNLGEQMQQSRDPAFVALAIRSLSLRPLPQSQAQKLAVRMEEMIESAPRHNFPFPPLGPMEDVNNAFPPPPPDLMNAMRFDGLPRDFALPFGGPVELLWYAAAAAHFRAGNIEKAKDRLERIASAQLPIPINSVVLPDLAMVLSELNLKDDAESTLHQFEGVSNVWVDDLVTGGAERLSIPWFDFLECVILYREAHLRIRGTHASLEERLQQIEQRALNAVNKSTHLEQTPARHEEAKRAEKKPVFSSND